MLAEAQINARGLPGDGFARIDSHCHINYDGVETDLSELLTLR